MRNHNEKARDMSRSVLPSSARKAARDDKRAGHKRARQANRAVMHHINRGVHADDFDAAHNNYRADLRNGNWIDMVEDRREADKIAPLRRWVAHKVEHDPKFVSTDPAGREALLLGMIGNTKIGRHALSHVRDIIGDQNPHAYGFHFWGAYRRPNVAPTKAENLALILESFGDGELNRAIKLATERRVFRYYDHRTAWVYRADCGGAEAFLASPDYDPLSITESSYIRVNGVMMRRPHEDKRFTDWDAWKIAMKVLDGVAGKIAGADRSTVPRYRSLVGLLDLD